MRNSLVTDISRTSVIVGSLAAVSNFLCERLHEHTVD